MAQYIDKSTLVSEIEKYISNYKAILNKLDKSRYDWLDSALMLNSKIDVLQHILYFLDTLEVKEVDLEKEIYNAADQYDINNNGRIYWEDISGFAKHFFELGLKTKGE